jgi:hypothetical protein
VANDPDHLCERCIALIPADDAADPIPPYADDAIAAAVYALQAAAGLDEHAAGSAAQRVMDSLDNYLLSTEIDLDAPGAEQRVWEHPLVRAEITRRDDDLRRLSDSDRAGAVGAVRETASRTSALPLERQDR